MTRARNLGAIAGNSFVSAYNNNVGIGTTTPTSTLQVQGNGLITGVSTIGNIQIASGIITATTGIVTYYGDGSKLSGVSASGASLDILEVMLFA